MTSYLTNLATKVPQHAEVINVMKDLYQKKCVLFVFWFPADPVSRFPVLCCASFWASLDVWCIVPSLHSQ